VDSFAQIPPMSLNGMKLIAIIEAIFDPLVSSTAWSLLRIMCHHDVTLSHLFEATAVAFFVL
jgi:hypothetical protein